MLDSQEIDTNKKIMIIGCGGIGSEIANQLLNNGYRNIAILSSRPQDGFVVRGAKIYNINQPMDAILGFNPNIIFDVSDVKNTQGILREIMANDDIKNFRYVAITPDLNNDGVSTQENIMKPNIKSFQERGIEVIRTDKTNTLFSDMISKLVEVIKSGDFRKITISDNHRLEKELFTQGGINAIEKFVNFEEVEQIDVKINKRQENNDYQKNVDGFKELVVDLRGRQERLKDSKDRLKRVSISLMLKDGKEIKIKTLRNIPNADFGSKTGCRSWNQVKVNGKKFAEAIISKKAIADGVLQYL